MAESRFHDLHRALCAAGVAARYARRAVAEVEAHRAQLIADACAQGATVVAAIAQADELIGSDQVLIERYASRPELLAFSPRRPALAFSVLPLLGLLVAVVGLFAAVVGLPQLWHLQLPDRWVFEAVVTVKVLTLWIGPVALSVLCARLAWRHALAIGWPLLTMLLVCMLGTVLQISATYDDSGPRPTGELGLALGFPPAPDQILRGAITLAVALLPLLALARSTARRRSVPRS